MSSANRTMYITFLERGSQVINIVKDEIYIFAWWSNNFLEGFQYRE
jgi:hypothetical protein